MAKRNRKICAGSNPSSSNTFVETNVVPQMPATSAARR